MIDRNQYDQQLREEFQDVDGTHVAQELWPNPDKALLPPPLTEEQKRHARKHQEENHGAAIEMGKERIQQK